MTGTYQSIYLPSKKALKSLVEKKYKMILLSSQCIPWLTAKGAEVSMHIKNLKRKCTDDAHEGTVIWLILCFHQLKLRSLGNNFLISVNVPIISSWCPPARNIIFLKATPDLVQITLILISVCSFFPVVKKKSSQHRGFSKMESINNAHRTTNYQSKILQAKMSMHIAHM